MTRLWEKEFLSISERRYLPFSLPFNSLFLPEVDSPGTPLVVSSFCSRSPYLLLHQERAGFLVVCLFGVSRREALCGVACNRPFLLFICPLPGGTEQTTRTCVLSSCILPCSCVISCFLSYNSFFCRRRRENNTNGRRAQQYIACAS